MDMRIRRTKTERQRPIVDNPPSEQMAPEEPENFVSDQSKQQVVEQAYAVTPTGSKHQLKKRLRAIEKEMRRAKEQSHAVQEVLHAQKSEHEQIQNEIIELLDERGKIRDGFEELIEYVEAKRNKEYTAIARIEKKIEVREKELSDESRILLGLQYRYYRNQSIIWSHFLTLTQQKIQAAERHENVLEKDIKILWSRYHGIANKKDQYQAELESMQVAPVRRGRIISGIDLNVISARVSRFQSAREAKRKELGAGIEQLEILSSEKRKLRESLQSKIVELQEDLKPLGEDLEALRLELKKNENRRASLIEKLKKAEQEKPKIPKQKTKTSQPVFVFPKNLKVLLQPSMVYFTLAALVVTSTIGAASFATRGMALKGVVLGASEDAYSKITDAGGALKNADLDLASQEFEGASERFAFALEETSKLGQAAIELSALTPKTRQLKSGNELLKAGESISLAASEIAKSAEYFSGVGAPIDPDLLTDGATTEEEETPDTTLTDALKDSQGNLLAAADHLNVAGESIESIHAEDFPDEYQEQVEILIDTFPKMLSIFNRAVSFVDSMLIILGHDQKQRYLLLFQNNTELRGTGGFIGSFGVADIDRGKVENVVVDGIYNPDGQLLEKVYPPSPLRFITPRWYMRDANWYPDYPTAASHVAGFYEKSGGSSVDGVISFTPTVIENLLKLTGPIEMPEYETTVSSENFVENTQYEVEIDYDKVENRPKKFLADLMPKLLSRVLDLPKDKWIDALSVADRAFTDKHILVFFFDDTLEAAMIDAGFGGEVKDAPDDYLSVINSNILGGKTDSLIEESISHKAMVQDDGDIIDEVTVTRVHTGDYIWPSGVNRDYIRVYVPLGSELLDASGFEDLGLEKKYYPCDDCETNTFVQSIEASVEPFANNVTASREFGKTVFAGWQSLDPGSTKTYTLRYRIPMNIDTNFLNPSERYSLYVQKQSGSLGSKFRHEFVIASDMSLVRHYPSNKSEVVSVKNNDELRFESVLASDKFFGAVIEKQ